MTKFGSDKHKILLNLLKKARVDAGLRQVDLAKKLKVPQSLISKYEVGERRVDLLEILDICAALEISPLKFVKDLEESLSEIENETE